MPQPITVSWNAMTFVLPGWEHDDGTMSCASLSALRLCSQLHGHAFKRNFGSDIFVDTATLDMYVKCDNLFDT
ncbi:hypothetical protein LguiA_002637 [Lonicera macranthoides]